MADVTLVISSETAKAVKDLVKLAQTQAQVESATKKADETAVKGYREQAKAAQEMERAATLAWKRTKAAQHEALRDGLHEMKAAAAAHDKDVSAIDKRWGGLGKTLGTLPAKILGFVGAAASVQTVVGLLRDVEARFEGVSRSADETAKAMRALSVQTAGKEGAKFTRETLLLAAGHGMAPEDAGVLANTIKSIQGADFKKEFQTGAQLANLGVAGSDAAPIIQTGVVRGMGGQRAAELALTASDLAPWAVGDVAKVVPKTLGYSSLESGLAAGVTLRTAGVPLEQMPASVEALQRVLTKDKTPLSKKFHLAGLSESERIAALSAAADASGDREEFIRTMPEKYKLGEEESRALRAALSMGGDFYGKQETALRGVQTGELDRRFESIMQDPLQRREYEARRAASVARATQELGPVADAAEQVRARTQATGMKLLGEMPPEAAMAMTDDSGSANLLGRTWSSLQRVGAGSGIAGAALGFFPGGMGRLGAESVHEFVPSLIGGDNEGDRNKQTDALLRALEANTEATNANTQASGGDGARRTDRNAGL